jgi:hypothetical protein
MAQTASAQASAKHEFSRVTRISSYRMTSMALSRCFNHVRALAGPLATAAVDLARWSLDSQTEQRAAGRHFSFIGRSTRRTGIRYLVASAEFRIQHNEGGQIGSYRQWF